MNEEEIQIHNRINQLLADFLSFRPQLPPAFASDTPDYVEPIKAYRSWLCFYRIPNIALATMQSREFGLHGELSNPRDVIEGILKDRNFSLRSVSIGIPSLRNWVPREMQKASCGCGIWSYPFDLTKPISIGAFNPWDGMHKCGLYAWKYKSLMVRELEQFNVIDQYGGNAVVVHGAVWLWGTVIDCESGYRAEYAYPAEFWGPDPHHWPHMTSEMRTLATEFLYQLSYAWDVPLVPFETFEREGSDA